jgi:hypothetical protein
MCERRRLHLEKNILRLVLNKIMSYWLTCRRMVNTDGLVMLHVFSGVTGNPAHMPGLTAARAIVKDEPLLASFDSASDLSYANMCDLGSLSGMRHVARASPGPDEGAHLTCCSLACAPAALIKVELTEPCPYGLSDGM